MPETLPPVPDPAAPPKRAADMKREGDREGPVLADSASGEIAIERGDAIEHGDDVERPPTTHAPVPPGD